MEKIGSVGKVTKKMEEEKDERRKVDVWERFAMELGEEKSKRRRKVEVWERITMKLEEKGQTIRKVGVWEFDDGIRKER